MSDSKIKQAAIAAEAAMKANSGLSIRIEVWARDVRVRGSLRTGDGYKDYNRSATWSEIETYSDALTSIVSRVVAALIGWHEF